MSYTVTTSNNLFDLYDTFDSDPQLQIPFEFEYIEEDGTVTKTDINLVKTDLGIGSLTVGAGNYISSAVLSVGGNGGTVWTTISDPTSDRLENIEAILRQIQDKLMVVEEQDESEMKQALRKAYEKFRMVEDMIGKKK